MLVVKKEKICVSRFSGSNFVCARGDDDDDEKIGLKQRLDESSSLCVVVDHVDRVCLLREKERKKERIIITIILY